MLSHREIQPTMKQRVGRIFFHLRKVEICNFMLLIGCLSNLVSLFFYYLLLWLLSLLHCTPILILCGIYVKSDNNICVTQYCRNGLLVTWQRSIYLYPAYILTCRFSFITLVPVMPPDFCYSLLTSIFFVILCFKIIVEIFIFHSIIVNIRTDIFTVNWSLPLIWTSLYFW